MKVIRTSFLSWLPLAVAITGLCLLIYGAVQQNYRQSLNDPQIQMAEDAAAQITGGASVQSVVPTTKVDISQSLAPWIAVYNVSGTPLASSGMLDGSLPNLPQGVLDTSTWAGPIVGHHLVSSPDEDRITWQPRSDVREAIVIVPAGNYFVVAGRNMREVENREGALSTMIGLGWIALMIATFCTQVLIGLIARS